MKTKLLILIATCLSIILCGCAAHQTSNEADDIAIVNEALLLTGTPVDEVVLSRNSEHIFSSPLNAENFFDIDINEFSSLSMVISKHLESDETTFVNE